MFIRLHRFCRRKHSRIRPLFLIGIFSLLSFALVFRKLSTTDKVATVEEGSARHVQDAKIILTKEKDGNKSIACKVPVLDPFHPSVVNFMKDLGKLNCEGVSYSSFEDNVLRVEGEGIVSAQYRKIERPQGNDFGVVLSDPVRVLNTSGSGALALDQKGERNFHLRNVTLY